MNKRDLIKWLEIKREEAIQNADEQYQHANRKHKERLYMTLELEKTAENIECHIRNAYEVYVKWREKHKDDTKDRLTVPDERIDGGLRRAIIDAREVRKKAMTIYWRLKKYEDTGLAPEEILDGKFLAGWIPVSEQLPDESDYYCVTTEDIATGERIEQTIWFAHKDDYDIEESEWRELADYERVIAWKKSDPYSPGN